MPSDPDSDSDGAPEELTFDQGIQKDEEIKELQRENTARVAVEKKERRRRWAQRRIPKEPRREASPGPVEENSDGCPDIPEMLPQHVVSFLASNEKRVFSSDSEHEKETVEHGLVPRKTKQKKSKSNTVLLKNLPPPPCAQNTLDFLKKRKAQVPRSQEVLRNADKALRLWARTSVQGQ